MGVIIIPSLRNKREFEIILTHNFFYNSLNNTWEAMSFPSTRFPNLAMMMEGEEFGMKSEWSKARMT